MLDVAGNVVEIVLQPDGTKGQGARVEVLFTKPITPQFDAMGDPNYFIIGDKDGLYGETIVHLPVDRAILDSPMILTIHGTNLTDGMELALTDCHTPVELPGGSNIQRQFQCTPTGTRGAKVGFLKAMTNGEVLYTFTIDVTGPTVYNFKPFTVAQGVPVVFTVTGIYLDHAIDFILDNCSPIEELPGGSNTQRQFQCTPSTAGSTKGFLNTSNTGKQFYSFIIQVVPGLLQVTNVAPTTGTLGTSVIFTVTGANLTDGMELTLTDCPTPVELPGGSDTQRQFQCTPTGTAGTKTGIVKFVPNDEILYNFTVEVNDSTVVVPQIAGVTPATATLNTPVTFTLTGTNLKDNLTVTLTDCPTPVELPGGTDTQRQFQCTPTGTVGPKAGTVKDSNGEVLYNFNLEVSDSQPLPTTVKAPTDLTATATGTQVTLHWTDQSDNETGFRVFRDGVELTTVAANLTQFIDTGLACGTPHTYQVKATNATGESAPATTNVTLPPCIYTLTLETQGTGKGTIGGTQAGQYPRNTQINLTAQPDQNSEVVGWTPASCGSPFALTADTKCIAKFDLNRQQVNEVLSNFCTLNPDFIDCQVFETAKKCPADSTDPICQVRFYPVTANDKLTIGAYVEVQPNKTVPSLIGLNMVFSAYGDNLTDSTKMAVDNCEGMTLLPDGTSSRRDFFCKQWGLPGDRKGIVKDHNGVELYQFDVKVLYTCKAVKDLPLKECETLDNIYQGTQGGAWKNAGTNKWLVDVSPCGWAGITCANGHVTHLLLADNNLTGTMPDICALTELRELDLSNNRLTGNLPNLCQSNKLEAVNLSSNQFNGTLPDLTGLTNLKTLGLANNQLEGKVPDFSQLPNLKVSLGGNQLLSSTLSVTQPIPEVIVPQGGSPMTLDLTSYFTDTSGSLLTYRVSVNSNANVVTTTLQNNSLLLTFGNLGSSEITVEAQNSIGMTVASTFKVTVSPTVQTVAQTPVYMPTCANNTGETIDSSCVGQEQVLTVSKIENGASISNVIIDSSLENQGWISNSKVTSNGSLTGGTLSGFITNEGTITNVEFLGAELKGGMLSGKIVNNSKIGGIIKDVKLDKDAHLQGGNAQGNIEGNCDSPALLEDVTVKNGSTLSCVVLGKNVKLEVDVKQDRVTVKEQTQGGTGPTPEVAKVTEMVIGNLIVYADSIVPDGNSKSVFVASGNVKLGMVSLDSSGQQQKGNQIIGVDAKLKLDVAQKRVETLEDGEITALGIKRTPDEKDPGENMPLYRGGFTVKVSDLKSSIVKNLPQLEIKPGGMSLQRLFPQELYPFTANVPQAIEIDSTQVVIMDSAANFSELFDNFFINLPKIRLSQEGDSEHKIELIAEDALRFRNNKILRLSDVKVTLDLLSYKSTIGGKVSLPEDEELFGIFESLGGELKFWKTQIDGFEISAEGDFFTLPPKGIPMGINFAGAKVAIENFAYPDSLKFSLGTTVKLLDGFGLLKKFEDYTTLKFLSGEGELSADTSWKIQVALKKAMLLDKLKLGEGSIEYKPGEGLSVDGKLGVSMKKFVRQNEEEVELLSLKINPPLKVSATDSKLETNGGGELSITIPEICLDVYITELCSSEKKVDVTAVTFGVSVSDKAEIDEATGQPTLDEVTGKPKTKTGVDYIRFTFDAGELGIKVEYTDTLHFYTRLSSDEYTQLRKAIRRTEPVVTLEVNKPDETVVFQMVSKTGEPSFTLKFPDGRVFQPATTPGLFEVSKTNSEVAYLHSANKHQASYVVKKPPQGTYTVEVNNLGDIGEYELNLLYTPKKPTIKLVSLAQDQNWDSQSPVNVAWQFTDPNGGAKVSLYYDNDNTGYNGSLIAADIPAADGYYEWKAPAEMQSGHYYLYAKLDDGKDIPVYAYSTGKLAVANSEAPTTPTAVTLKAGEGTLEVSWAPNPEDNLASYRVHVSDTPGDNRFEQDIGVGLQTSYAINGLTNGKTYEVAVSVINNKGLVSLLSTPQTQTPLGEESEAGESDANTTAIDPLGTFMKTKSSFKGGISVNGEPELPNVTHTTSDEISVIGETTADFAHLGKVVDWLVIGIYKPTPTSAPQLYMLEEPEVPIEQQAQAIPVIRPWDGDLNHLVAMKKAVILRPTQRLNLWQGQLSATGEVQIYYGYRLPDGTIVLNPQPLEDVITE